MSLLLDAFQGTNQKIPVWFMRQAGRFLPQYQAIKKDYSLQEMFLNPELASRITCLPVEILGVDAAILFADILSLPAQMGFDIDFTATGPVIGPVSSWDKIHDYHDFSYIEDTIRLTLKALPKGAPLIGFAGGPFTVLTYLMEGGSSVSFAKTLRWMQSHPKDFDKAMRCLTKNTISYLQLQVQAGIHVFQIFDTWAGILPQKEYRDRVLPYIQSIFEEVSLPSIYYAKHASHLLEHVWQSGAEFISLGHDIPLSDRRLLNSAMGIQGNLFNGLLYADYPKLQKEVESQLRQAQTFKRYIFNLSHGFFPDTDVEKVKFVIDLVHNFPRKV